MENSDKLYLLMEILGHDVKKHIDARKEELFNSKKYKDIYKQLWMMRVQPGEVAQRISSRIEKLKDTPIVTYYDVAAFAQEIEVISLKGNQNIVINPYIYNYHRKYTIKTVGELKIPYAKTMIDINEYIMGAELAGEKKTRFLGNIANEWYEVANKDISAGINKTTNDIKRLEEVKRFRFPFYSFVQVFSLLLLILNSLFFFKSENIIYQYVRINTPQKDIFGTILIYGLFALSFFTFIFSTTVKMYGKHYHSEIKYRLYQNLTSYQKLMSKLALKHDAFLATILRVVNAKTFLRVYFSSMGIINPTSYAFDQFEMDAYLISKKEYNKMHLKFLITNIVFVILLVITVVLTFLKYKEVF